VTSIKAHPTAIIHEKAELGDGVEIGPYSIIGEHVKIRRGTRIASHVVIEGWTLIGEDCQIFPFATIGTIPQDLKFKGEESRIVVGDRNAIREYVTIHRGTAGGEGVTTIGSDNLLMAYVHVAHDCRIGNRVILANAATLAGHVTVQDHAVIGGLVGVHQFTAIGRHAFIGGCSCVTQDVPPFVHATGNRVQLYGLNTVGLKRSGFSEERLEKLKKAYRILFRSKLTMKEAIRKVRKELADSPDVEEMASFIEKSERGICR
jgi:UDP-N-acetylglucosamine acyltransferase